MPRTGAEMDPAVAPPSAQPEFDLIAAWAPFPVEFGQSWWLDAELATAEPDPELIFAWAPFPVEFGESRWLDPDRAADEPPPPPPVMRQRAPPFGIIGSLGVHLLPLLMLLDWHVAPAETGGAIPVQFVLEEPPPASEKASPAALAASEDAGDNPQPPVPAATAPVPALAEPATPQPALAKPAPAKPAPARIAAAAPPPKPAPRPEAHSAPRRPASPPNPTAAARPAVRAEAPARDANMPGPATTREDYLAQLVTLTRRHLDLLPTSLIAGRSGETVVALTVLVDGTIAHLAIAHSSGYPDIDARAEQMVAAVRRFPPLPAWFHGASWDLNFRLRFPFPDLLAR